MQTVPQLLEAAARWYPDRTMLAHQGRTWTYGEVNGWANQIAHALTGLGLRPGDPVALLLPSQPVLVAAYYGVMKAGAITAPLNAMFTPPEVAAMVACLGSSVLITTPALAAPLLGGDLPYLGRVLLWDPDGGGEVPGTLGLAALAATSPATDPPGQGGPDDVAAIFHTSGTTGRPKGAAQTHANVVAGGRQMVCHAGWRFGREHVVCPLPLFNNFGSTVVLNMTVITGGTLTIVERWDADEVLAAFAVGATRMVGTPTMYVYLLSACADRGQGPERLDPCIVGGQTTPLQVRQRFEQRFGARLQNLYGATEAHAVTLTPLHGRFPDGSVGHPVGQSTVTVVGPDGREVGPGAVGELVLGGDTVCAGYWRDRERTAESFSEFGWLSGDLGFADDDGYIHVVDRKKDLIITGGANIYPAEIEAVLYQHPAVALATVIGVPDPVKGEIPKAFVVARPGEQADPAALIAFTRERLAAYKCPRAVEFVDQLPTSPVGKVLKRDLKERVLADSPAEWA